MIIHDWDDPRCISVLRNCCKQLDANGRVICIDAVLPPLGDTSDAPGKLLDVNMMLVLSGRNGHALNGKPYITKPDWNYEL